MGSAVLGFIGQICITSGYKYVEASKGSMVSSSRIVFAALLGFFFFLEIPTWYTIAGGLLIATAIVGTAFYSKKVICETEKLNFYEIEKLNKEGVKPKDLGAAVLHKFKEKEEEKEPEYADVVGQTTLESLGKKKKNKNKKKNPNPNSSQREGSA